MNKDIFDGKIKQEYAGTVLFSILLGTAVFAVCAVALCCFASFYQNAEQNVSTVMYIVSAVCFACAAAYPVLSIVCIRTYPKRKRLAHLLLKDYVFAELSAENDEHKEL